MYLDLQARLAKKLLELTETHGQAEADGIALQVSLTQDELAAMVGATRPRVNRLLGSFEDRGLLSRRGRRLVILNPDALHRLVEW
jgi:CRP-like cAMP-binding protein